MVRWLRVCISFVPRWLTLSVHAQPPAPLIPLVPLLAPRSVCSMAWSKMNETELHLAKKWYMEDGESTATIAERLGRDQSTITRLLVKRKARKSQGRPPVLTAAVVDNLEKRLNDMVVKADGKYEVTVAMLKKVISLQGHNACDLEQVALAWDLLQTIATEANLNGRRCGCQEEVRDRLLCHVSVVVE